MDALRGELATTCDEVLGAGKKLNWVFLGAPGVGKGTYASRMAKQMGVPHISMGDLVRAEIKGETALGKELKAITARASSRRTRWCSTFSTRASSAERRRASEDSY